MSVVLTFAMAQAVVSAEPYWVEWSGDAFPETEGWTRTSSNPPAERWLEDGSLFIDSRADWLLYEGYAQSRPGMMTPGPGETFVMQWRVRIDEVIVLTDPGILVRSDDQYAVVLVLGVDFIQSAEEGISASFSPNEWHEFVLESADMRTYQLYIDGALGMEGSFYQSVFTTPEAGWGDITTHRSLSQWDEVGFGIVPEPSTARLVLVVFNPAAFPRRLGLQWKQGRIEEEWT